MNAGDSANTLGKLIAQIAERNARHVSNNLIIRRHGKRMSATMLRSV
jgi:hypothetical protein